MLEFHLIRIVPNFNSSAGQWGMDDLASLLAGQALAGLLALDNFGCSLGGKSYSKRRDLLFIIWLRFISFTLALNVSTRPKVYAHKCTYTDIDKYIQRQVDRWIDREIHGKVKR